MLWIVFSVFWSFRVAPRSGTNAEWYQGPGPISISWISSPFSWNLYMKVQRREKTMLLNRLSHHPDELKLMAWRTSEINDWNQFLGVSWKGSTSTSKWRHPIQKSTLQWMKAETPVDCFQSSCLYDPSWRQFPRCNLCTSVYCNTIKSSNYFSRCPRPITSPPLSGAVGSSSAAGSVWRNGGSSSAGVDSAPGHARGDALICLPWTRTVMRWCSLPIFALSPYPLSACNANKVLPCCVTSALLAIATLQKEVERMQKYQKNTKDARRCTIYIKQLLCTPNWMVVHD